MIILGPVPCQGCRRLVVWATWRTGRPHDWKCWRDPETLAIHRCAFGYRWPQ